MFLFASCSSNENLDNNFTLTGCIVSSPHNAPVSNCVVEVTNGNTSLASTITNEDGLFKLTIDINMLDNTHYLAISDNQYGNTRSEKIQGVGTSIYDYRNIVLYDSRNPYNLPTFEYANKTYVVHPVLARKYTISEIDSLSESLNDYGIDDWYIPSMLEMEKMYWSSIYISELLPLGQYLTSDRDGNSYGLFVITNEGTYSTHTDRDNLSGYVVPVSTY